MSHRLLVILFCAALLVAVVPSVSFGSTPGDGSSMLDASVSAVSESGDDLDAEVLATLPSESWVQLGDEIVYEEYAGDWPEFGDPTVRNDPHEFRVTMRVYKLPDTNFEAKDWYLTELEVWTSANTDNDGKFLDYPDSNWNGGVVLGRTVEFDLVGAPSDVRIVEYSPVDVIGATTYTSTVGYSIGGSITNTGGGISGSYSASKSTSYTIPDVSINYTGTTIDPYAYWYEDIGWMKPASTGELLTGYKVIWTEDPTDGTIGFDLDVHVQTAICSYYKSSNHSGWSGCREPLSLGLLPLAPPWEPISASTGLTYLEVLNFEQTVHVGGNLAPRTPNLPSVQSPVKAGQSVPVTMVGSDRDGNPIEFAPDFGDGTPFVYGPAIPERGGAYAVNHAWSTPGTYGVRIYSHDIHGAESTWSPTFFVEVLPADATLPGTFVDDDGSQFEADIEWIAAQGITKGCNPPTNSRYCPNSYVTRGQMAAFLVRAMGYDDNGGGDLFGDDDGSTFEGDIDRLATAGVTKGCNPPTNDRYCPNSYVTRGQMAAFLHRALG